MDLKTSPMNGGIILSKTNLILQIKIAATLTFQLNRQGCTNNKIYYIARIIKFTQSIFPALVLNLLKDVLERSKKTLQQVQGEREKQRYHRAMLMTYAITVFFI